MMQEIVIDDEKFCRMNAILTRLSDGFSADLRGMTSDDGEARLRKALRAYIDVLEDMYRET